MKVLTLTCTMFLLIFIPGCSGNGEHSYSDNGQGVVEEDPLISDIADNKQEVNDTAELVASREFDFRIDEDVTFFVYPPEGTPGAVHIYSELDAMAGLEEFIPDPLSRITTLQTKYTNEITLSVNKAWQHIYFEWVPMTPDSLEQVLRVNLNNEDRTITFD